MRAVATDHILHRPHSVDPIKLGVTRYPEIEFKLLVSRRCRVVKILKCVEESQSSMMDVEDEHNRMDAAFGLRYRIG